MLLIGVSFLFKGTRLEPGALASPSQQQDDELVASQIDDAPQGYSRAIVPVQSSTVT